MTTVGCASCEDINAVLAQFGHGDSKREAEQRGDNGRQELRDCEKILATHALQTLRVIWPGFSDNNDEKSQTTANLWDGAVG